MNIKKKENPNKMKTWRLSQRISLQSWYSLMKLLCLQLEFSCFLGSVSLPWGVAAVPCRFSFLPSSLGRGPFHFGSLYSLRYDNILIWIQSSLDLSWEPCCFYGDHPSITSPLLCIDFLGPKLRSLRAEHTVSRKLCILLMFLFILFFCSYTSSHSM